MTRKNTLLPLTAAASFACLLFVSLSFHVKATEFATRQALVDVYKHFHQNPELSFKEIKSAQYIANEMQALGFSVTEQVGGHGVVGIIENGQGPTVMIRADMDALPVKEETGVDYASTVTATDIDGIDKPVMHACGHDIHMTVLIGTARTLAAQKSNWQGTLMMIAQPAEERGAGARAMLEDGLFERFPRPDFNLALHVNAGMPAGTVGYVSGPALANVDSVDIAIYGVGGHGAYPHTTKDPIVLAAQIVLALQTIVSREISPLEPAVITVGSIHGGHKHNIIPDEAHLQLTLRSYTSEVREKMITTIRRITENLGRAAGLPEERLPKIEVKDEYTPVAFNNPELTERLVRVFERTIGTDKVWEKAPVMGGEDFGRYGQVPPKIPSLIYWLGAVNATTYEQAAANNGQLPSLHSSKFAPDFAPTIDTGVKAMTAAALELMAAGQEQ
ncbi:MAG: amidohydrolase [Pseudomonadota bacterium]